MKKLIYTIFALGILLLSSCTEPIELDLNQDNNVRLVVDAFLTSEKKAHLVDLTLTTDYFTEGIPDRAEGAIVSISNGTTTEILDEIEPGKYYTSDDYTGEENTTYTLSIDYKEETYKAVSTLLPVTELDSIQVLPYEEPASNQPDDDPDYVPDNYEVFPFFQEPEASKDYYMFKLKINDEYWTKTVDEYFFTTDEGVNGSYIGFISFYTCFAEPGDEVIFEQYSLSLENFETMNAILLETSFRGGLWDGAPANVPSNIDNGALGIFVTADIEKKSVIIEE